MVTGWPDPGKRPCSAAHEPRGPVPRGSGSGAVSIRVRAGSIRAPHCFDPGPALLRSGLRSRHDPGSGLRPSGQRSAPRGSGFPVSCAAAVPGSRQKRAAAIVMVTCAEAAMQPAGDQPARAPASCSAPARTAGPTMARGSSPVANLHNDCRSARLTQTRRQKPAGSAEPVALRRAGRAQLGPIRRIRRRSAGGGSRRPRNSSRTLPPGPISAIAATGVAVRGSSGAQAASTAAR